MSTGEPPQAAAPTSKSGSPVADIDNMKVPELKKRLKSMGLSTTGNKSDLVERLQEAYLGEKDGSLDGGLDDESLEEALLNDDPDQSALQETILGNEEFSFSSPEKDPQKLAENVSKPLKKRVIAQSTPIDPSKAPKPIVLKRNNYTIIEPLVPSTKKDHPLIEPPKSEELSKAEKVSTVAEKLQIRANRFNISSTKVTPDSEKEPITSKSPSTEKVTAAPKPILAPASAKAGNLEVLRKRAQRFGENVSTVMKQLENQEKLMKRKLKFTDSGVQEISSDDKPLSNEQERKKKRMERFGQLK